ERNKRSIEHHTQSDRNAVNISSKALKEIAEVLELNARENNFAHSCVCEVKYQNGSSTFHETK
ncbi:hypothetical protein CRM22_008096, partial [Opisthorchis felineus]